ncbi:MAG: nucleotide sugar dehydrogenase, partial [Candidatus Omnitrophota bacterium]|nr:nucleotide sugar dehydrogenase [Candidatus Omnitrophota bacterium]
MGNFLREFKDKVRKKEVKIAVVGLGYVGLPLAVEFAKKGFRVLGLDIDKQRLRAIKKKESYITDISDNQIKAICSRQRFEGSADFKGLKKADVIIICVPTPLKRKYHPNISYIKQAVKSISRNMKTGVLIILESTTYPGTTEEVILPLLEKNNLRHDKDFYLSFSPERIDPGNSRFPVNKIPKIVGGLSPRATELAVCVYENIIDKVVPVSSVRTAEFAKLLENTYRLINIGLIDELAMMAHKMKINIWEVIDAASTKPFGFMPFYPGPGVGGHCIPKDPLYLYWKARHAGFRSRFIKLASAIINYMPEYVVQRVEQALKGKDVELKDASILVIGVTYKKDIRDLRKSPSIDIIEILRKKCGGVSYFDPLIPYLKINHIDLRSIRIDGLGL